MGDEEMLATALGGVTVLLVTCIGWFLTYQFKRYDGHHADNKNEHNKLFKMIRHIIKHHENMPDYPEDTDED